MVDIKFKDMTGQKLGKLTVLERAPNNKLGDAMWLCACECGKTKVIKGVQLRKTNQPTRSCGCMQIENMVKASIKAHTTHGHTVGGTTPEYRAWCKMKERCCNTKNKDFPDYGGRGITVCARWLNSFENFFSDMGLKPSPDHSLDRVNVNGPYSPDNCRWATKLEQAQNKRPRPAWRTEYNLLAVESNTLRDRIDELEALCTNLAIRLNEYENKECLVI